MPAVKLTGEVVGETLDVRFAVSGTIASVAKRVGDTVKVGDLLASLDKKQFQIELDQELADYQRRRADFEIYHLQSASPSQTDQYLAKIQQAQLDASVKQVELAHLRLAQADLFSPVAGVVVSHGGLVPRLHITPGSYYFTLLPRQNVFFQFAVSAHQLSDFVHPVSLLLRFSHLPDPVPATTAPPVPTRITKSRPPEFIIQASLPDSPSLLPGLTAQIELA